MGKSESKTPPKPSSTASSGSSTNAASKECHPKCTIESKTVATSPADRKRTKIGVGEEVGIIAKGNPAEWTKSGGGTLDPESGTQSGVIYTAEDKAESVTITAKHSGCGCSNSITFTVVEPSDWTMKKQSGTNLKHTHNRPDCGWKGIAYVHPNDVNFYNIETREKDSQYVGTGSYKSYNGDYHGNYKKEDEYASSWFAITDHTETDGSTDNAPDTIYTGLPSTKITGSKPPFKVGKGSFPITWQWRVGTGTPHDFPLVSQEDEIFSDGKCESRKGGNTESTMWDDADSDY